MVTHSSASQASGTWAWTDGFKARAGHGSDEVRSGKDEARYPLRQVKQEMGKKGRNTSDPKHATVSLRGWEAVLRGLRTCFTYSHGKGRSTLPVRTEAKERPFSLAALS